MFELKDDNPPTFTMGADHVFVTFEKPVYKCKYVIYDEKTKERLWEGIYQFNSFTTLIRIDISNVKNMNAIIYFENISNPKKIFKYTYKAYYYWFKKDKKEMTTYTLKQEEVSPFVNKANKLHIYK